ncbi:outer membrane protein assembly factor BamA [Paraburkholderia sp. Tr-20389]|uniref:outer membrane protein assembly factor BamA n=1 Tax=Paraburkholderia sp. Tr-20389 TaxID=2703903 RepID=UPI00198257A2|nr:outer membrane protein assembly factor BamA [Paraburkholderia sp. Tr-20389]MBN3758559.1 outer membrane protein assembly factor BamA [Paraburkholderia sp. Tr-20389]
MKRDLQRLAFSAVAACLTVVESPQALANNPVVKEIRIEGLRHLQPDRFLPSLPLKPGDTLSDDIASKCLNAMYNTGLIADATVDFDGEVAVFHVVEKPTIAQLEFSGLHALEKNKLSLVFKDAGIALGLPLDKALLNKGMQTLRNLYIGRGFHAVKVEPTVTPLDRDRVSVLITVSEGPVAKIRQITFVGNEHFQDNALRREISLRPSDWSSWYTKNDVFTREALAIDVERLRGFYLDRGFIDFSIDSVQASVDHDGAGVDLTVALHEGAQYFVGSVQLTGDLLGRESELTPLVGIRPREPFSLSKLSAARAAICERLGRYGYGLADVQVASQRNQDNRALGLILTVNPGQRLHVRRVNIMGNTRTRDEVIRREMLQLESAWFDRTRVAKSIARIKRLELFSSVESQIRAVEGYPDQIDIDVTVTEKKTGSARLSAASSSSDKFSIMAGLSEENLFGTGHAIGLQVDTSIANRQVSVREYSPYVTPDGVSRSSDMYYKTTAVKGKQEGGDVDIRSIGADLRFGLPVSDDDKVYLGLAFENDHYSLGKGAAKIYQDYLDAYGTTVNSAPLTFGWLRDMRDDALVPSAGYMLQADSELGTPLGGPFYYRTDLRGQYFYSFAKGFVLSANVHLGYGQSLTGDPYPIGKRYYAGGIGSVRGYAPGSLGPKDQTTGDHVGGTGLVAGSLEMTVPLPGSGWDRTLRVFSFLDAGKLWDEGETSYVTDLRYSCGAGVEWLSPVGPLKLSLAMPLVQNRGDEPQYFQFQIGTSF